ncbi:MAG: hypothetical protein ACOYD4_04150 [Solirubrobacterales bacterium]
MNTWAPLWVGIVDSSVWDEPDHVCKVFMTMLALKDADHVVRLNAYQLGRRARKTEGEVLDALRVLASPDTRRIEPQPYEGRRIQAVEDGWLVLNGAKYRAMVSEEMRKARNRRSQAAYRERKKAVPGQPLPGEERYLKAEREGAGQERLDQITTESLPESLR